MLLKLINQSTNQQLDCFPKTYENKMSFSFLHEVSIAPRKNYGVAKKIRVFGVSWINVKETIYSCWSFVSVSEIQNRGWTMGTLFALAAFLWHDNYFGSSV